MQNNIETYVTQLPEERQEAIQKMRAVLRENLPEGFAEDFAYGMIAYVVPHTLYPNGYHCDPKQALPFMSLASQKNFIALYHMGIYMDKNLYDWFVSEYPKHVKSKLDMGKSCIRFKKINEIPYELIAALASKMTREQWIACYESNLKIQ
jgi:uncharacterized protein YdhG (YjbR/CyaY superfamily)